MKDNSKNFLFIFTRIILASFTTLIIYIACGALILGFANTVSENSITAKIFSIILTSLTTTIFSFLLVFFLHKRPGYGEKIASKDFENGYCGFFKDIKNLIVKEKKTLIILFSITAISCVFNLIDSFLLQENVFTYVSLVFAPMFIISTVFSQELPFLILGYMVSAVLTCIIYILILAIQRKSWYKKWNRPKK